MELGRIFGVGVTDFAMDFSAKTDGFCDGFCGGFLSCVSLKEKTDFGTDFPCELAKDGKRTKL